MTRLLCLVRRGGLWSALACAAVLAGCAHPCGYVDVRTHLQLRDGAATRLAPVSNPMRLAAEPSSGRPVLSLRVERKEVKTGPADAARYGRRVVAPYQWYAPIVQPLGAVTLFVPLYYSAAHPHDHGANGWSRWDYLRDVVAWFNIFSAMPTGRRRAAADETVIERRVMEAACIERRIGLPGARVSLSIGGRQRAEAVSNADGLVEFDLSKVLTAEETRTDQQLVFGTIDPAGSKATMDWRLGAEKVRFLRKGHAQ